LHTRRANIYYIISAFDLYNAEEDMVCVENNCLLMNFALISKLVVSVYHIAGSPASARRFCSAS